jgi:Lon protease-like protein
VIDWLDLNFEKPAELPIFPLSQPLFPGCRLPLRIFEPRYVRMVSEASQAGTGFVITLLKSGSEVATGGSQAQTQTVAFHEIGCWCQIIDFETLNDGMLGITVAGESEVHIGPAEQAADGLWLAGVEPLSRQPLPEAEPVDDLRSILAELRNHPLLDNLLPHSDEMSGSEVLNNLCCWLPFSETKKQTLLSVMDYPQRLTQLRSWLQEWMR